MQILQWLKGQIAVTSWANLPQITGYDQIDEEMSTNFGQFVNTLNSNVTSQALYQQIQIMRGLVETGFIQDIAQKYEAPFEEKLNRHILDGRTVVTESLDLKKSETETSLTTLYNQQLEAIRLKGVEAISSFEEARALASWSNFYADRVNEYQLMLFGKVWPQNATSSKLVTYRKHWRNTGWKTRIRSVPKAISSLASCTRKAISILFSKTTSFSGKRFFWFSLLGMGVLLFIVVNFISLYGFETVFGIDVSKLRATHSDTQIFAKISTYLALFLVPTIGYSFANKNYRIYSNLLEQYRHREIVAKTIQGILARPRGDEHDEAVRKELANVAASALFEQKTVGHLSKNEANSTSLFEVFRTFKQ